MKRYIAILLLFFVVTSCFEDTGNYKYKELQAPNWMKNYSNSPQNIKVRYGSMANFKGSSMFVWDENAEQRAQEVRYEWRINDKVISEEMDFQMPVEELMQKAGIKDYSGDMGTFGTFCIIEKETGVSYMAKILLWVYSYYTNYDWFVLSQTQDNSTSMLSSLRSVYTLVDGKSVETFDFEQNAYKKKNDKDIPGKALQLNWSKSKDFGSQGCITVITDQAAYMLNSEDLNHVSDLSQEFLDGTPANFKPVARVDINPSGSDYPPCTFVANADGKVYSRVQSKNYLGGKFLTEAYEIDEKGYDITLFGNSRYGGTVPCYDAKNQRLVMASVWREDIPTGEGMNTNSVYRTKLTPIPASQNVYALDYISKPGSEVLHISFTNHGLSGGFGNTSELYTIFFNLDGYPNNTYAYDVSIDNRSMRANNPQSTYYWPAYVKIPVHLNKDDVILETGNSSSYAYEANYRTLFTCNSRDNRVYYMQRTPYSDAAPNYYVIPFPDGEGVVNNTFPAKITAMNYDYFYCDRIMIGLENGDFYLYDLPYIDGPKLLYKGNTGGKVISFKQLGSRSSGNDNF